MASFNELVKSKPIEPAFLRKQAAVADIKHNTAAIGRLDTEVPNARTYARIESAANGSLLELKEAMKDLDILLFKAEPDIKTDKDYVADKKLVRV